VKASCGFLFYENRRFLGERRVLLGFLPVGEQKNKDSMEEKEEYSC